MRALITLSLLLLPASGFAQAKSKDLFPKQTVKVDLSEKRSREITRLNALLALEERTGAEQQELDTLLERHGEFAEDIWNVIGPGCSWYCGGGNYKVEASSVLSDGSKIPYSAEMANDLSYATAWVEGVPGGGTGEYLEYHFRNESPRVTNVIVSNGYVKNQAAWKNNNRVKKLKMYVNNKEAGILNLKDTRDDQVFDVGMLGHNADKSDLVLRFEIMEVYRGDRYDDTAITEIYFDGTDVH